MGKGDRRRKSEANEKAEKTLRRGRPPKEGPREPSGRLQRPPRETQEKAMHTALVARAKENGIVLPVDDKGKPIVGRETAKTLGAQWRGCVAGRAIAGRPDASALWQVIQAVRARRDAWLRCIDSPGDHPRGAAMPTEPNPPQEGVTVDRRHDTRTEEEKADAAERLWNDVSSAMFVANPLLQRVICLDEPVSGPIAEWIVRLKDIMEQRG